MEPPGIVDDRLAGRLSSHVSSAKSKLLLIAPFVTAAGLDLILSSTTMTQTTQDKRLVLRWRPEDLISGSSDLQAYHYAKAMGFSVYINVDIHAKLYVSDDLLFLGSANLTVSALENGGNVEVLYGPVDSQQAGSVIKRIMASSTEVTDAVVKMLAKKLELLKVSRSREELDAHQRLQSILNELYLPLSLYVADLPWSQGFEEQSAAEAGLNFEHDLELFGAQAKSSNEIDQKDLVSGFRESKCNRWLRSQLNDEPKSFGYLSKRFHETLVDDPAPYRKTVKRLVKNLLSWAELSGVVAVRKTAHSSIISIK